MTIHTRVQGALDVAWAARETPERALVMTLGPVSDSMWTVLGTGSTPAWQMLLTILAGTAESPGENPAALQRKGGGVDRRTEARHSSVAFSSFRSEHGLAIKVSKDPGVSHPYRESAVTREWADRRKGNDRLWAEAILTVVEWLREAPSIEERKRRAVVGLAEGASCLVRWAVQSSFTYPKFRTSPRLAMQLVREFLDSAAERPDALEAVMAAATRTLVGELPGDLKVARGDVNSPDPIDITIRNRNDTVVSGIEITDEFITRSKLENEVVEAMLDLGFDSAIVVSRGPSLDDRDDVERYLAQVLIRLGKSIELVTIDVVESWLNFPGLRRDLASDFMTGVGVELDEFSSTANRATWYEVLVKYATQDTSSNASI